MTIADAMLHEGAAPDDGAMPRGGAAPGAAPGAASEAAPGREAPDWLASGAAALGALLGEGLAATGPAGAHDLLAAILDAIPDGVRVVDPEGAVLYENRALRERIGPAIACSAYFDGDARLDAGIECPSASALLDGLPHEVVREVACAGGERAYFELRSTPFFDRTGRLAGALTVVRDETARVTLERERARYAARLEQAVEARTAELERAREMFRSILDGIPDMIALLDAAEGKLIFANAAAQALPEDTVRALRTALCQTSLMAGRTVTRILEHVDAAGRARVFESFAYPVPSMKEGGTLSIHFARDITARRALEQQAIRNERLAVVGELAAGLAHEIRTPLTSISNSVRLLEGALPAEAGEETRLVLGIIAKEARRLSALLADFLTFARPRPPRPVPTDLNGLVREAVGIARRSRPQAEAVAVELALAEEIPEAPVDRDQLQQALLNILTNGLDACLADACLANARPEAARPAAARLTVRTAGPRQGRAGWEIAVSDSGPGIAPQDLPRLFEPFFSKKPDGTGLGLAITKRIVDAHGGRVEVLSQPGAGASFTVVLPAASGAGPLQGA